MWRVSKIQREGNIFLQEIDNYLFAEEIEVINDKITLTKEKTVAGTAANVCCQANKHIPTTIDTIRKLS